ncbi:hypothetical protein AB0L05_12020 [Nonomuraea pusilla]|uniref:hypothetical protein n=1 Tax=Nonomuraea pusilla TaxID=46177 RepID=UPI003333B41E
MRKIIALGLAASALTACGGGPAESLLDAHAMARLRDALVKQPDLPDGFSDHPDQAWTVPFAHLDANCRAVLDLVAGRAPTQALTGHAAVSYQGDALGEQAAVGLASYADGEAEDHLDELGDALESCREVRGAGTRLRLRDLPVQAGGGEAVGARLRGRLNGYPYTMDVVLSRVNDTVVGVVHAGLREVDAARTKELVDAVVRMAGA